MHPFERDHQRLLAMLDDVAHLSRKGSHPPAAKVFGEFRRAFERHLAAEERALDALYSEGHCPPTLAARTAAAHVELKAFVETTWQAMSRNDAAACATALGRLIAALSSHERSERDELLPALGARFREPHELERALHALFD